MVLNFIFSTKKISSNGRGNWILLLLERWYFAWVTKLKFWEKRVQRFFFFGIFQWINDNIQLLEKYKRQKNFFFHFISPLVFRIHENHTPRRAFTLFFTFKTTISATWGMSSCFRTRQFYTSELFLRDFSSTQEISSECLPKNSAIREMMIFLIVFLLLWNFFFRLEYNANINEGPIVILVQITFHVHFS